MCTSISELPTLVSSFLFILMWGCAQLVLDCVVYCDDKRCEMVGHTPRIICFAMTAVFMQHLQLGSFVTGAWLRNKAHPPNKGCVIRNKTMRLTDKYALNTVRGAYQAGCMVY